MDLAELNAKKDALWQRGEAFGKRLEAVKGRRSDVNWYPYGSISNVWHLCQFVPPDMIDRLQDGRGWSALDIGAADGDIAYYLEDHGWTVDIVDNPPTNFNQCKALEAMKGELSSRARIDHLDIDRPFELSRQYDLVVALGILYHLKNPFAFLSSLALHSQRMVLSTRVARQTREGQDYSFVPGAYLLASRECNNDSTNFWIFTPIGLERILTRCGWRVLNKWEAGASIGSNPVDPDKDERHFVYCERVPNWEGLRTHSDF